MEDQKKQIAKSLYKMSLTFNKSQQPSDEALKVYADVLIHYPHKEVSRALFGLIKAGSPFFPSCSEIIAEMNPKVTREDADLLAGRAIEAISEFGSYRAKEAMKSMGSEAWKAVEMLGGWQILCNSSPSDLGTLRAQLRANCMVSINNVELLNREAKRIESRNNELNKINFNEIVKKIENK